MSEPKPVKDYDDWLDTFCHMQAQRVERFSSEILKASETRRRARLAETLEAIDADKRVARYAGSFPSYHATHASGHRRRDMDGQGIYSPWKLS